MERKKGMMSLWPLRRLLPSVVDHRQVEKQTARLLRELLEERFIDKSHRPLPNLQYLQKNFFSILFLAVYRSVGISQQRRIFYGTINHAIRGIVTGTDNLLDDECKEMLPLRLPASACRFKSVMHILLFDRFLCRTIDEGIAAGLMGPEQRELLQQQIFRVMVPIGEGEASEEGGVSEIFTPREILSTVHSQKGGNLLRLAFVAPCLLETSLEKPLALADQGIYRIGVALQVIDDLTDFYQDIDDRRHNYLMSVIRHEGSEAERKALSAAIAGGQPRTPVEMQFPASVRTVIGRAVGEALDGFGLLEQAGFWLSRRQAAQVIRYLFQLRGVGNLLTCWPSHGEFHDNLQVDAE